MNGGDPASAKPTHRATNSDEGVGPADTRRRILSAATELIVEQGYDRLSLERVAERAGVVRATIYYQFHSRAGLLEALLGAAEERGRVHATRDEDHTVRDLLDRVIGIWEEDGDLIRGVLGGAVVDEQTRQVVDRHQRGRRQRIVELVEDFDRAGHLRGDREEAVDLLWMLTNFHTYDFLRQRTGRDPVAIRRLLETLAGSVFDPAALGATDG